MRMQRAIHRYVLLFAAASLGAVLLFAPLQAQRGRDGRHGGGMQGRAELEQRMRAQMARMIRDRLELTDDQAERLSEVTEGFMGRRRELARSEQATRRRVEALMLEGGEDDDEARELLARVTELRTREAALFVEEQAALLEVLTPVQVLRMQELRKQLGQRIRSLRGRGNDQPRARRRGGPGDVAGLGTIRLRRSAPSG